MKRLSALFIFFIMLSLFTLSGQTRIQPPEVKQKVEQLLARMTLEEKIGQMTQLTLSTIVEQESHSFEPARIDMKKLRTAIKTYHVGSFLNVLQAAHSARHWQKIIGAIQDVALKETPRKIPVIYGVDSVHGVNYLKEATIFPHSINMAATFDTGLVKKEGEITAYEMRACGLPWNFNPVLGVARKPMWSRVFETYGEDTYLAARMGEVYVKAQEGENNAQTIAKDRVAVSIKHYLGYSMPLSGKDKTPAWIPERQLREYFLPPFHRAVLAGTHTLMAGTSEVNGVPVHASPFYLKTILRDELGFEGFVVSDWSDIKNLHAASRVASSPKEAVRMAVMAGVDMSMVPLDFSFYHHLLELVKEGSVPMSRIDEAVGRILMVKFKLGLFDNPYPDETMLKKIGSPQFRMAALQAACESIILLKNNRGLLPLRNVKKILVTGPTANRLSVLNSGWSFVWQGDKEEYYPADRDTILEALEKKIGKGNVSYAEGSRFDVLTDVDEAVKKARFADVIIACLGEDAYCEAPGIIDDLALPDAQVQLIDRLAQTGKPIVLVLAQGRPRLIRKIVDKVDAILLAFLPGIEGGSAVAHILAGHVNPSGKLPITYPAYPHALVGYDHKHRDDEIEQKTQPEFPFGFGLSYTTFQYKNLHLDKTELTPDDTLKVSVTVKNTGPLPGKESVLLFISDHYASIAPPVKRLRAFDKVALNPGEEKTVTFTLTKDDLSFIGLDMKPTIEPGGFTLMIGPLAQDFKLVMKK
jgi:beta-glucosidase